jgi:protein gp37
MSETNIEWANRTLNAIVSGCQRTSPGCVHCYAEIMAKRLAAMGQEAYTGLITTNAKGEPVWNGVIKINLDDPKLFYPLKEKQPIVYFLNSMTDLFHKDVPFEAIDRIMAIVAMTPHHTYQLLTKRANRMQEYFKQPDLKARIEFAMTAIGKEVVDFELPLPNLWLGVSVESQKYAEERIPQLLETPAAIRFLSVEPLLGEISFKIHIDFDQVVAAPEAQDIDFLLGKTIIYGAEEWSEYSLNKIDWVIVGGESGSKARPMQADWVRSLRDQCQEADVPFFFKQWGEYNEHGAKVGKKNAGRLLDGIIHNEFPKGFQPPIKKEKKQKSKPQNQDLFNNEL